MDHLLHPPAHVANKDKETRSWLGGPSYLLGAGCCGSVERCFPTRGFILLSNVEMMDGWKVHVQKRRQPQPLLPAVEGWGDNTTSQPRTRSPSFSLSLGQDGLWLFRQDLTSGTATAAAGAVRHLGMAVNDVVVIVIAADWQLDREIDVCAQPPPVTRSSGPEQTGAEVSVY